METVDSGTCGENVTWTLDSNGTLTFFGEGVMGEFYCWEVEKEILSVIVEDGITTISPGAFLHCSTLSEVIIPKSVIEIGEHAFAGCSSMINITVDKENQYYSSLDGNLYNKKQSVLIQYALGKNATSFDVPESVEIIETLAFYNGDKVVAVTIPQKVTVRSDAFFYASIADVYYNGSEKEWKEKNGNWIADATMHFAWGEELAWSLSPDGILNVSGVGAMSDDIQPWGTYKEKIKSVAIEDGITVIGNSAFSGCNNLTSVKLGKTVTDINGLAFSGCSVLTSIEIPNSVKNIWECAFERCGLTSISMPDSVEYLSIGAFNNCSSLENVTIGEGMVIIDESVFAGCDTLSNVYYCGSEAEKNDISIGGNNTSFINATWHYTKIILDSGTCGENVTWELGEDGILTISGDGAMADYLSFSRVPWDDSRSKIKTVVIKDGVTSIGRSAFNNCEFLTSITIPESVTNFGDYAFYACESLTSITIPDGVTSIGYFVFGYCSSLTSITIPDGVTSIEERAFSGCESLISITIPNGLMSIGDSAFYSCYSLTSITIGNGVTGIGEYAFFYCDALTDVYYGGTEEDKDKIVIGTYNTPLTDAIWHYGDVSEPEVNLATINGAQIRTKGNQGLRFISTIDKTSADFDRVKEFGIVLIPTEDITDLSQLEIGKTYNGRAVAKVEAKKYYSVTDEAITFTAVITGIPTARYTQEITARAYAIMDDGSVVYSDIGASRSIYAVAKRGLENSSESDANKAVFQAIVDAVENV